MQYLCVFTPFCYRPLLAITSQFIPFYAFKERHYLCYLFQHPFRVINSRLLIAHQVHDIHHNLAIAFGAFNRLYHCIYPLYPSFPIGKCSAFLQKR